MGGTSSLGYDVSVSDIGGAQSGGSFRTAFGGTVNVGDNGSFTYSPPSGMFVGEDHFGFDLMDTDGTPASGVFYVNVNENLSISIQTGGTVTEGGMITATAVVGGATAARTWFTTGSSRLRAALPTTLATWPVLCCPPRRSAATRCKLPSLTRRSATSEPGNRRDQCQFDGALHNARAKNQCTPVGDAQHRQLRQFLRLINRFDRNCARISGHSGGIASRLRHTLGFAEFLHQYLQRAPALNPDHREGFELTISGTTKAVDAALETLDYSSANSEDDTLWITATGYDASGNPVSSIFGLGATTLIQTPVEPTARPRLRNHRSEQCSHIWRWDDRGVQSHHRECNDFHRGRRWNTAIEYAESGLDRVSSNASAFTLWGSASAVNSALASGSDVHSYVASMQNPNSPPWMMLQVNDSNNVTSYAHQEIVVMPINLIAPTAGSNETLSATVTTGGATTQGGTVTATAGVSGTSTNSSLSYTWTVTAPNGTPVSVGTGSSISFTASQAGTYSTLVSVTDTVNGVTTAAAGGATISSTTSGGTGSSGDETPPDNIGDVQLPTITENTGMSNNPGMSIGSFVDEFGETLQSARSRPRQFWKSPSRTLIRAMARGSTA